jgi:methyl-accepting chemotaxis protein
MGRLETKILGIIVAVLLTGCVLAIGVVVYLHKSSLFEISRIRITETADIIAENLERSMLEGKPEATRAMVNDFRMAKGIESIDVFNDEGKEAFTKGGPAEEQKTIEKLTSQKETVVVQEQNALYIYRPLINTAACQGCHGSDKPLLGVVKIVVPLEKENQKVARMFIASGAASVIVIISLVSLLLFILRRVVIRHVSNIENAAALLAEGDLSFPVDIKTGDEIGRLSKSIKNSLFSISGVLRRIQEISGRIFKVAEVGENESRQVLEGTQLEAESVDNISAAVEELNASIAEISEGTDSLAASVEETAASMEQMSANTSEINQSTMELFTAVEETSSSMEQVSSSIKAVSDTSDRLSASSENTLSAMEELNVSIKEVDRHAKESANLSQKVVQDATRIGLKSVEKTIEGMGRIRDAVEKAADSVRKLGDRSEEIGKILTVIDEITEQTTLLSLNAAILASQAGEYGKGFSVVADEIKDLAERTSLSTQEIAALINAVQQEVSQSVSAMEEGVRTVEEGFMLASDSDKALHEIVGSAQRSSEMSSAIERATEQQATAVSLVAESMDKVKNMISAIVRATSEQAKGAALIIGASEKVCNITTQLKSSSEEQSASSKLIAKAMEVVSDKTQQISFALREQKDGANNIRNAIGKIIQLPEENRQRAMILNRSLRDLSKDAELLTREIERFKFHDVTSLEVRRFGVVPIDSPAEMFTSFDLLVRYLAEKTGRKVDLKVASNFADAVRDIATGVTQICYMTPSTYIQAHRESGVRVIAKALREGKPYHHSVIISKAQKGIEKIEDLRGKSFAFGDMNSTSSHIMPRYMLLEAGISLEDLSYYNYLGTHNDVAQAVLAGDFDAGGVMEKTALKFQGQGLHIIKYSDAIPEFNISVSRLLPEDEVRIILKAFSDLRDENFETAPILKSIDMNYTGFMEASDSDFDGIREIMMRLGMI